MREILEETWINFNKEDWDTFPQHSGNWDDTSKRVLVYYLQGVWKYPAYRTGYTDWDGDNHYWNLDGEKGVFEVIAWRYFNEYDKTTGS